MGEVLENRKYIVLKSFLIQILTFPKRSQIASISVKTQFFQPKPSDLKFLRIFEFFYCVKFCL